MSDTPPDWVLLEAAKRSKLSNDTPRQRAILFDTNRSFRALCDMVLEHEAFRQTVSDAAEEATDIIDHWSGDRDGAKCLQDFIIPKPKPDPLLAALLELELSSDLQEGQHDAKWLRIKLDELGFEIREKNDD